MGTQTKIRQPALIFSCCGMSWWSKRRQNRKQIHVGDCAGLQGGTMAGRNNCSKLQPKPKSTAHYCGVASDFSTVHPHSGRLRMWTIGRSLTLWGAFASRTTDDVHSFSVLRQLSCIMLHAATACRVVGNMLNVSTASVAPAQPPPKSAYDVPMGLCSYLLNVVATCLKRLCWFWPSSACCWCKCATRASSAMFLVDRVGPLCKHCRRPQCPRWGSMKLASCVQVVTPKSAQKMGLEQVRTFAAPLRATTWRMRPRSLRNGSSSANGGMKWPDLRCLCRKPHGGVFLGKMSGNVELCKKEPSESWPAGFY